jgi:L-iditol 2-dehydrogenase
VAIDINQTRLDFAKSSGFAEEVHCLPVAKERITSALSQFGEEEGFDVIFECTGAEPCIQMSIHVRLIVSAELLVFNPSFAL